MGMTVRHENAGVCMGMVVFACGLLFLLVLPAESFGAEAGAPQITVGEEVVVTSGGDGVRGEPSVATGAGVTLVVWREGWQGDGGASRIHMARLDQAGKLLDARTVAVAPEAAGVQDRPRVAFGGGCFLVVWQEFTGKKQYDVRAMRVSPQGKMLDEKSIAVAVTPENDCLPAIASDGQNFLVVWQAAVVTGKSTDVQITAATVFANGDVQEARPLFSGGLAAVAWNGKQYLVFGKGRNYVRLDASGNVLDANPKTPWKFINSPWNYAVAGLPATGGWLFVSDRAQPDYWGWGGPGAILCWEFTGDVEVCDSLKDYHTSLGAEFSSPKYMLYDDWLDMGGEKGDGKTWPIGQLAACWDGTQAVVVWQRHHLDKKVLFANCDLMASRVDGWKPLDRPAVAVAASNHSEKAPALTSDGAGHLVCTYEKFDQDGTVQICARSLVSR